MDINLSYMKTLRDFLNASHVSHYRGMHTDQCRCYAWLIRNLNIHHGNTRPLNLTHPTS